MIQLSTHFNLAEFISPNDPVQAPGADVIHNLTRLAQDALEPLRVVNGGPLVILSGFRSPAHNAAVGGAPRSQHVYGLAADIERATFTDQIKLAALASKVSAIGGIGLYHDQTILHVDIRPRVNGRITCWYQDSTGYHPLPDWLRAALVHAGAINLL